MSYQFPKTIFVDTVLPKAQLHHVLSEINEIATAETPEHTIEECWDAIHSLETLIRKIVKEEQEKGNFVNPHAIMLDVISKNKARQYYE